MLLKGIGCCLLPTSRGMLESANVDSGNFEMSDIFFEQHHYYDHCYFLPTFIVVRRLTL